MPRDPNQPRPSEGVDPFLGCEPADLPPPEGIAARWWCAKPPIGNTHPGATLPFGMLSVCAYSGAYVTGYGRYAVSLTGDRPERLFDECTALGLAHFQQSGTGRIRMYYNYFLTTPLAEGGLKGLGTRYSLEEESASPGYYSGTFRSGERRIRFETTCTKRTALHRYRFPEGTRGVLAVDLSSGGLLIEGMKTLPQRTEAAFSRAADCAAVVEIEGIPYHLRLRCLSPVRASGFWLGDGPWQGAQEESEEAGGVGGSAIFRATREIRESGLPYGIWFESAEPGDPMELRLAVSLHDPGRAHRAMVLTEGRDFDSVAREAGSRWDSVLGKISVEGGDPAMRQIFHTALYHSTIKPGDFRDENPFTGEPGPFFFDLSTLWDLYKTQLPLLMTLWPELGADFVSFLIEVAQREGAFPVSYLMDNSPERFAKQATGLCHMILCDAHMRGIPGDWETVLRLLWRTSLSGKGRGGKFAEYAREHLVQPLSHTLDLAYANWCLAQMAKRLGDQVLYDRSIPLSRHWTKAFDESSGLLREDSDYYEGGHWNYSFRFLHDMVGRIKLAGGEERFVALLDQFFAFADPPEGGSFQAFEGLNNEPDMESPYAYLYAGRHDRTAAVVRAAMRYQFTTGRGGLPGNDDSGGISSWYVWNAVGLFPVTGMPLMLIGSPVFDKAALKLLGGDFTVSALNQAPDHPYVQRAWLNGRPLDRAYLKLSEFAAEAELVLELGPEPSSWASETRPPSFVS